MRAIPATGDRLAVSHRPGWARLYLGYERHAPNYPGKRGLLHHFEYAQSHARHGGWTLTELGAMIASCGDYSFYEIRDDGFRAIADLATYVPPTGGYGADLPATCEPLASKS